MMAALVRFTKEEHKPDELALVKPGNKQVYKKDIIPQSIW